MQSRMVVNQKHKKLDITQCSFIEISFSLLNLLDLSFRSFLQSPVELDVHHEHPATQRKRRSPFHHMWSLSTFLEPSSAWFLAGEKTLRQAPILVGKNLFFRVVTVPNSLNSQGVITCRFGVAHTHLLFLHNPGCRLQALIKQYESPGSFK